MRLRNPLRRRPKPRPLLGYVDLANRVLLPVTKMRLEDQAVALVAEVGPGFRFHIPAGTVTRRYLDLTGRLVWEGTLHFERGVTIGPSDTFSLTTRVSVNEVMA